MKLTIESTEHLVFLDGVHCRVWEGRTETGERVAVFVHRIMAADATRAGSDCDQELYEVPEPSILDDNM